MSTVEMSEMYTNESLDQLGIVAGVCQRSAQARSTQSHSRSGGTFSQSHDESDEGGESRSTCASLAKRFYGEFRRKITPVERAALAGLSIDWISETALVEAGTEPDDSGLSIKVPISENGMLCRGAIGARAQAKKEEWIV